MGKLKISCVVVLKNIPKHGKQRLNDNPSTYNNNNNNRTERHDSRFSTISSLHCELFPTPMLKWPERNHVQIMCNASSPYHVKHVMLYATWYTGTAQLYKVWQSLNYIYLSFILLAEPLTDEGGEETGVPIENPW